MAIYNLALYYRRHEAVTLQGAKENSFGSLEGKLLRCKIKVQEHLSHTEQHVQVIWTQALVLCSPESVPQEAGLLSGPCLHRHQMHFSLLWIPRKRNVWRTRGISYTQVLGTVGERQGVLGNTPGSQLRFTHSRFTSCLEVRWLPLWNEL